MLKLYYVNLKDINKFQNIGIISEYRQNKLKNISNNELEKQGIGAELLLIEALKINGCCPDLPLEIVTNKYGKPDFRAGLHFNLSHSGEQVVCAISDRPVGIDVQEIVPYSSKLAKRFFTQNEYKFLEKVRDDRAFTAFWCTKESYIKLIGKGISSTHLDSFELVFDGTHCALSGDDSAILCWQCEIMGHIVACCSSSFEKPDEVKELFLDRYSC